MIRDKFLKYNAIMLIFTLLSGALNYLYQVLLGRILTPEEFGTIGAMISIFYITSIASWTISRSVTNFIAGESKEEVSSIIKYSLRKLSIPAFISGVAFIILAPMLSRYLKINEMELFYITSAIVALSFIAPVFQGTLLGLKRFKEGGGIGLISTIFKFSGIYLALKMRVVGAFLGFLISAIISLILSLILLRGYLSGCIKRSYKLFSYSIPVFVATFFSLLPTNLDLIIVKGIFPPKEAGIYASLTVLAKITFFISAPVATVLFSIASERLRKGESGRDIFIKSLTYTFLLSGSVTAVYVFYPEIVVKVFGNKYGNAIVYLSNYGLGMFFFVLAYIFLNYLLAMRRYSYIPLFSLTIIIYMSLIYSAESLEEVAKTFLIGNFSLFLLALLYLKFSHSSRFY